MPDTDAPTEAPQIEKLLRFEQVMERLDVSESTLRRLVRKGRLPSVKFDGAVRFRPSDVHAYVLRQLTK